MRLVLLGGGHAHLFVLEALRAGRLPGADVTLVSPTAQHAHAAMLPGLLAGLLTESDCTFDLAALARQAGARFVERRAERVELEERRVQVGGGRPLEYDYLSIATGAAPAGLEVPGVAERTHAVRPLERTRALIAALDGAPTGVRVAVVGGGATGIETAFAVRARLAGRGSVALLEQGPQLLAGRSLAAADVALRELRNRDIGVALGARVEAVEEGSLVVGFGARMPADLVVWTAGVTAMPLARDAGLATDEAGFVLVDGTLRSVSHPTVFAAGDAASLREAPWMPKAGAYAVRQGPVLAKNLAALATGKPVTREYRPQRDHLALIGTNAGRAIFVRGRTAVATPWAQRLKDYLDRGFVRRFQDLRRG
ncbi:MAG TPA: FAD-dependent oxidoreductase [Gemmatimonadales bacterium]|nr:FAD-dependent oxidoreductase [Gemmatimonadales bacterium]